MAKDVAQRKRDERKRKAEHLAAVGAKPLNMDMFSGTTGELERIKTEAGFEQDAEAITVMIHNVAALIDRDLSLFKEVTSIENLRKSA
ncbi:hypothetical protein [Neptunomonas japonica]|uniref:Uncharacterized protein n=1 Tax=Neptunomonas japonica JAMM 1380 TaxID=1441457 RepID=A0A7R6PHQ5_9GAMM|nr:hypothetical protein [Neptunomonas japonica]BBB29346.1 conserved hypothetical protein [Neptunomonas japonica JAMM 1380]